MNEIRGKEYSITALDE